MRRLVWLFIALSGCASSDTVLWAQVRGGHPTALSLNVYDPYGRVGAARFSPVNLPGTVVVEHLTPEARPLRVVALGEGTSPLGAFARVQTVPHGHAIAPLELGPPASDRDGDGVPDELDDCPDAFDPEQSNALGEGAGDACRGDGGTSDAAGPSLCASAAARLCDGFEGSMIDGTLWSTSVDTGAMAVVDSTRAYRGTQSLHVHTPVATDYLEAYLVETKTFPAADIFARAFVYVPAQPAFGPGEAGIMAVAQGQTPFSAVELLLANGAFSRGNSLVAPAEQKSVSTPSMPTDRWFCLELEVKVGDTASGAVHVWLDDLELTGLGGAEATTASPPIAKLQIGLAGQGSTAAPLPARDLWIDEMIVDDKRIGCAK